MNYVSVFIIYQIMGHQNGSCLMNGTLAFTHDGHHSLEESGRHTRQTENKA